MGDLVKTFPEHARTITRIQLVIDERIGPDAPCVSLILDEPLPRAIGQFLFAWYNSYPTLSFAVGYRGEECVAVTINHRRGEQPVQQVARELVIA